MKIPAISDDEVSVSQHFGRAPYYVVLRVEDGKIVDSETRAEAGHHTFGAEGHAKLAPGERHGYDAGSQAKHRSMADTITDCEVLIASTWPTAGSRPLGKVRGLRTTTAAASHRAPSST